MGGKEGYGESLLPMSHLVVGEVLPYGARRGIPTVVYLSTALDDEKFGAYEEKVFEDERVGVASRFFNCLRISLDRVDSKKIRRELGADRGPSILLLDAEGKTLGKKQGWGTTSEQLYRYMQRAMKRHYKINLATLLKKEGELLGKIDEAYWEIEDLKYEIGLLEERKDSKSAQRQIAKLRAEIEELEKKLEEVKAEEKAFLDSFATAGRPADN
jgi:hypothetical protein